MTANAVNIVIKTTGGAEATATLTGIGDAADKTSGHLSKIGDIAGGIIASQGIAQLGGFLKDAAQAAIEDEASTQRVQTAIKQLGGDYDAHIAKLNQAIKAGQELGFTDDDTRDAITKLALATGDTDEAMKRLALAQDLARGANIPLADASKLLGKVTDENLQVFKRMGITLPGVANEADVLAAVQAKFAGQSDAYANSTAGQFAIAGDKMHELKESIGAELIPVMLVAAETLNTKVLPALEGLTEKAKSLGPAFTSFKAAVQPAIDALTPFVEKILVDAKKSFDDIATALQPLGEALKPLEPLLKPIAEILGTVIVVAIMALLIQIDLLIKAFTFTLVAAIDTLTVAIKGITIGVQAVTDFFQAWGPDIGAALGTVWEVIDSNVTLIVNRLLDIIEAPAKVGAGIIAAFANLATSLYNAAKAFGENLYNGVKAGLGDLWPFSPSKRGIMIGEGLNQGVAVGLANTANMVIGAATSAGGAVAAAFSGSTGMFDAGVLSNPGYSLGSNGIATMTHPSGFLAGQTQKQMGYTGAAAEAAKTIVINVDGQTILRVTNSAAGLVYS